MSTIRLSTNLTLILKLVLPVAWTAFFSSFLLSSFLANPIEVPQFTTNSFRTGVLVFILGGMSFFYFTFFRLKRMDADNEHIYISNYFKTYRYTFDSIDSFVLYDHLLLKAVHINLKEKGELGKRIIFIPKMIHFNLFLKETNLSHLLIKPGAAK